MTSETSDPVHIRTKADDILDAIWTIGILLSIGAPMVTVLILGLLGKLD